MGNYLIAADNVSDTDCHLGGIWNVEDSHELLFGAPRAKGFPDDAHFKMNPDYPKGIRLTDALSNTDMLLVASARLVAFLESIPGALLCNEILPVQIINHKGRTEKAKYSIIHQVSHPPCVDEAATIGTRSPINPAHFQLMEQLVLDEKRIDERLMLFRAAQYPDLVLVRRDLAEKLAAQNFSGLALFELDEYEYFG